MTNEIKNDNDIKNYEEQLEEVLRDVLLQERADDIEEEEFNELLADFKLVQRRAGTLEGLAEILRFVSRLIYTGTPKAKQRIKGSECKESAQEKKKTVEVVFELSMNDEGLPQSIFAKLLSGGNECQPVVTLDDKEVYGDE